MAASQLTYDAGVADASRLAAGTANPNGFIPKLWSAKINKRFWETTVFGDITSNEFISEITGVGDKIVIMNTPTVATAPYTIGAGLTYARPTLSETTVTIDRAVSFSYKYNNVEKKRAKADYVSEFADAAANQMKIDVDTDILQSANVYNGAHASNKGNTAGLKSGQLALGAAGGTNGSLALKIVPGSAGAGECNVFDFITRLSAVMDEQSIPETDRWLVVPPLFRTKLVQSGQALALLQGGDDTQYRNGKIGKVDNWSIYISNHLYTATEGTAKLNYVLAGHKSAMVYASQITELDELKDPNDFGMLYRGLNVYGFKVIKPEALINAVVYF